MLLKKISFIILLIPLTISQIFAQIIKPSNINQLVKEDKLSIEQVIKIMERPEVQVDKKTTELLSNYVYKLFKNETAIPGRPEPFEDILRTWLSSKISVQHPQILMEIIHSDLEEKYWGYHFNSQLIYQLKDHEHWLTSGHLPIILDEIIEKSSGLVSATEFSRSYFNFIIHYYLSRKEFSRYPELVIKILQQYDEEVAYMRELDTHINKEDIFKHDFWSKNSYFQKILGKTKDQSVTLGEVQEWARKQPLSCTQKFRMHYRKRSHLNFKKPIAQDFHAARSFIKMGANAKFK